MVNRTVALLIGLLLLGCESKTQTEQPKQSPAESLIEQNVRRVQVEEDRIDAYVRRHKWDMEKSGTGLRIMTYEKGAGLEAEKNMTAFVEYSIELLNGQEIYTSDPGRPVSFLIGQDNVDLCL